MQPCANQAGRTKQGTCTRLAVTSTFMALAHVNSPGTMKACALERSPIPSLPCARLFLDFLFALCSTVPWLSHFIFSLRSIVWPPTVIPPLFIQPNPHLNAHTMPRERGKSRRGPLYYNALTRHNRLPPSQLALIITSRLDQSHNRPQQPRSPTPNPTNDPGSCSIKEEILPPENFSPPPSLHPGIAPPPKHPHSGPFLWHWRMLGGGRNSSQLASGYSNDNNGSSGCSGCRLGDGCRSDGGVASAHPNSTSRRAPSTHLRAAAENGRPGTHSTNPGTTYGPHVRRDDDNSCKQMVPNMRPKFVPAYNAHGWPSPSSHLD
jgi:hypothetical protein